MISVTEFKKHQNKGDIIVIDVRETWEYDEENIGAKNIPLGELPDHLKELEKFKAREIIVHCQSGRRSNQAQKYLTKQGFNHVKSLDGGLSAYIEQ